MRWVTNYIMHTLVKVSMFNLFGALLIHNVGALWRP